jgi:hypothetical protein
MPALFGDVLSSSETKTIELALSAIDHFPLTAGPAPSIGVVVNNSYYQASASRQTLPKCRP